MKKLNLFFHRLRHWEYWPVWAVYFPCFFQYLYYAAKSRSWVFFSVANPGIKNGGAFFVPKDEIYNQLPKSLIPKTLLIQKSEHIENIKNWYTQNNINYPLLLKPNHGLRGLGLKIIYTEKELTDFLPQINAPYLVQEFITDKEEVGIFFVKNPSNGKVQITSIVRKEFMSITGNGKVTIEALLLQNPRYAMQLDSVKKDPSINLQTIPAPNQIIELPKIGNHSRGTIFKDGKNLNTPKLNQTITRILSHLPEVYYGRLDIKFDTTKNLQDGIFKIIELNGAFSEPAHIYDPNYSIWNAWKTITQHFQYLYNISIHQIKAGHRPMSLFEGLRLIREHFRMTSRF